MGRASPAIRRHKASNRVIVYLDGAYRYFGEWSDPAAHQRAHAAIAEYLAAGRRIVPVGASTTVAELADLYLASGEARDDRDRVAVRETLALYSALPVSEFGALKLQNVRGRLIARDLCRNEVNKITQRIVRMFRFGASREIVPASVVVAIGTVKGLAPGRARESRPITPAPEPHVWATLTYLAPHVAAAVQVQWWTGMRSGEVLSLTPAQVDRTADPWVYRPARHKTSYLGRERVIYLGARSQAVLSGWISGPADLPCFRPRLRAKREVMSSDGYAIAIARACRRAGVPHWHPHQLRHAAATRIRAAAGLEAAQVVLGHRHAQTTEIYAEANRSAAADVMRRVG